MLERLLWSRSKVHTWSREQMSVDSKAPGEMDHKAEPELRSAFSLCAHCPGPVLESPELPARIRGHNVSHKYSVHGAGNNEMCVISTEKKTQLLWTLIAKEMHVLSISCAFECDTVERWEKQLLFQFRLSIITVWGWYHWTSIWRQWRRRLISWKILWRAKRWPCCWRTSTENGSISVHSCLWQKGTIWRLVRNCSCLILFVFSWFGRHTQADNAWKDRMFLQGDRRLCRGVLWISAHWSHQNGHRSVQFWTDQV